MNVRIETLGSIFEIDEDDKRYRRFPKHEGPREKPEWSDERAGALQDAIWHSYEGEWGITHPTRGSRLVIQVEKTTDDKWMVVSAPNARVI